MLLSVGDETRESVGRGARVDHLSHLGGVFRIFRTCQQVVGIVQRDKALGVACGGGEPPRSERSHDEEVGKVAVQLPQW